MAGGRHDARNHREWWRYGWVYLFAAIIGFSTTLAEPALIAVAFKANQASRGTIRPWGLRLVVAVGVGAGISLGTFRIVTGASLVLFIAVGYVIVVVQTVFAPKSIIPLAYDSGGSDDIDGDSPAGDGPRPRAVGDDPGAQPCAGWLRVDRLREFVSHDDRDGLRPIRRVVGPAAFEVGSGRMK